LSNILIDFIHKHDLEANSSIENIPALVMISSYIYFLVAFTIVPYYTVNENLLYGAFAMKSCENAPTSFAVCIFTSVHIYEVENCQMDFNQFWY
jgi:hypothetical protein